MERIRNNKDEIVLDEKYKFNINSIIGRGSFGCIYLGFLLSEDKPIAIKQENSDSNHPQLPAEAKIYNTLNPHGIYINNFYY